MKLKKNMFGILTAGLILAMALTVVYSVVAAPDSALPDDFFKTVTSTRSASPAATAAAQASHTTTVYEDEITDEIKDETLSPYFFVQNENEATESFPLKKTNVTANVNGQIADIYVVQMYANEGNKPINAQYVFPASCKVSVHGMTMEIGNNRVTAQIKERQEAKETFETAKDEGKNAALLTQQRPNVFTMDVANIMPGDNVLVELHYTELISSVDGIYQFVYPTVVGPRYSNRQKTETPDDVWVASPYMKEGSTPQSEYDIKVNLSCGVPVTDLECVSHKVDVKQNGEIGTVITLSDASDFAGNRDFILNYAMTDEKMNCGLMLHEDEDENFFMLTVQPPKRVESDEVLAKEYIFVLDVSGSMSGYPLDTAKELIKNLLSALPPTDYFNVILFSGTSAQMSPFSVPAVFENINNAINIIEQENGGGGTELAPAIEQAVAVPEMQGYARSIVVITDGYIDAETAILEIIQKNLAGTSFFSFGIGSSVNRYLIDGIAKAGMGESFVVTKPSEASDTAKRFCEYIKSPVLSDIIVTYDGFDVYDIEQTSIPVLFAQKPVIIFGKWRGEPMGTVKITGKTGNGEFLQSISVSDIKASETNTALRYLWARSKAERISDYGFDSVENDSVKKEVTALGLKYSMLTEYTSFVAVIEEIRNPSANAADVNQPLPLPLGVSDLAVGYASTSEPGTVMIVMCVLMLFTAGLIRKRTQIRRGVRL